MLDKISTQENLVEELTLLPGRVSRCFFMVATMDAQAAQFEADLKITREEVLKDMRNPNKKPEDMEAIQRQIDAITQLHCAQKKVLIDKLYVEKRAMEWFRRAQSIVGRYNSEFQNSQQHFSSTQENVLRTSRKSAYTDTVRHSNSHHLSLATPMNSHYHEHHNRVRFLLRDSNVNASDMNTARTNYNLTSKKRRLYQLGLNHSQKHQDQSMSAVSSSKSYDLHSGESLSRDAPTSEATGSNQVYSMLHYISKSSAKNRLNSTGFNEDGVIIKLGYQKSRPKKSSTKQHSENNVSTSSPYSRVVSEEYTTPPPITINTDINFEIDDNLCPICNQSESSNPSMVACDSCDSWYHCVCVGFVDEADAASKAFYCPRCSAQ